MEVKYMKNVLRKVVIIIMAAALSMSFTACMRYLDRSNAEKVAKLLGQKYGIEFEVQSLRNRLASDKANTVTAYCYPKNNAKVIFEAVMNVERELVSDDYPVRLLEVAAKEKIEAEFSGKGIEATVAVSIACLPITENLLDANLTDIISAYPELSLTFTTVLCEPADARETYDAVVALLEELYSGNPNMSLGTTIWKYSNDAYSKCSNEMNSIPDISKTVLEQYKPISKVNIAIVNGEINTTYETFEDNF